eukprot:CAMPEP_0167752472 /NCGR_PEP_ID=MMETSP0110_2-20121227/7159_1 /TAXON_ID=629695 /ORGANISM="Gymnochlora sp., Strain CCMP2014" /LENGTH=257 /DNA_ID=CAMNT_0007638095 /DNA_START=309 /DNA_END=1082 /DNA_ORIENTATION=+
MQAPERRIEKAPKMPSRLRDTKVFSDDMGPFDFDFDKNDEESQRIYKTIPKTWNARDIRADIEERMRIPVPEDITEAEEMKWMWVQCTLMTRAPKLEYDPDAEGWEKWRYERPKLRELYQFYGENFRTERQNVLVEYCNDPEKARERYGNVEDYKELMDRIQKIMETPPVLSPKVSFDGFPSFMDEETIRGTFEEFGEILSLDMEIPDDESLGISGVVEFDSVEAGQKAIAQWNGVDMGLGVNLSLRALSADPDPEA